MAPQQIISLKDEFHTNNQSLYSLSAVNAVRVCCYYNFSFPWAPYQGWKWRKITTQLCDSICQRLLSAVNHQPWGTTRMFAEMHHLLESLFHLDLGKVRSLTWTLPLPSPTSHTSPVHRGVLSVWCEITLPISFHRWGQITYCGASWGELGVPLWLKCILSWYIAFDRSTDCCFGPKSLGLVNHGCTLHSNVVKCKLTS